MGLSDDVKITATADTNQALTAIQGIDASLQRLSTATEKTNRTTEGMFTQATAGAKAFAAELGIVATAAGVVQMASAAALRTMEEIRARQKAAAMEQVGFAGAHRQFAQVLSGQSLQSGTERVLGIAAQTGVQPVAATLAAEGALGALGGLTNAHAFAAVEEAAKYRPGPSTSAGELGSIAQAIMSLQKQDRSISAPGGMAFIKSTLAASRVNDLEAFGTNLLPMITNARSFGSDKDSLRYLASMAVGIGDAADDPTGRKTGTGFTGFLKQIKAATASDLGPTASVEEQMKFLHGTEKGTSIRKKLLGPMFGAGADTMGKLGGSELEQLADRLAGVDSKILLHGENRTWMPLIQLLQNGDNRTKAAMASAFGTVTDVHDPGAVAAMRASESALSGSHYQQAATTQRALKGFSSSVKLGSDQSIIGLGEYDDALRDAGVSWPVRVGMDWDMQANGGNNPETLEFMQRQLQRTKRGETYLFGGTPSDAVAGKLDLLIEKIQVQIDLMRQPQKVQVDIGDGATSPSQPLAPNRAGQ